jgi:hypothetical protein
LLRELCYKSSLCDLFTVAAEEIDLSTVRVVVIVPELTVKSPLFGSKEPTKNCTVKIELEERYIAALTSIPP